MKITRETKGLVIRTVIQAGENPEDRPIYLIACASLKHFEAFAKKSYLGFLSHSLQTVNEDARELESEALEKLRETIEQTKARLDEIKDIVETDEPLRA